MELTLQEQELLSYIDSIIPANGHLEFDFRDEKQYAFATLLTRKNFDTTRYPGKLKALEVQKNEQQQNGFVSALGDAGTGFTSSFKIPGIGLTPGTNTIASNGIGTVTGGYASMSLLLFVKDNKTGKIIASGTNNELAGSFLPVATLPSSSTSLDVKSYLSYSAVPTGGGTPMSGIVTQGAYNAVDPVVTQPVSYCTHPYVPNAINIGLGRPWGDASWGINFDYGWNQTGTPTGMIPFVGSVVFSQNIQPLSPNTNFLLQIYVANGTGGGTITLQPTNLASVYNCFSIDSSNPKKLNWNLPGGLNAQNPGNPITFGGVTWPTDILAYFYCQIIVTLADGSFGSANVQSQTTVDDNPLDGTKGIKPISFVWHCLGEDTQVTMEDGSTCPIEDIVAGDKIQTGQNGEVTVVQWTNKGVHFGNAVSLETATGEKIISTDNHLFITPECPFPAYGLRVGDPVMTASGPTTLTAVKEIHDCHSMFYNLATTVDTGAGQAIGTFVANGFVVGDINAQRQYRAQQQNDINWVKQQIPDYLHPDADSYFEDKAKK